MTGSMKVVKEGSVSFHEFFVIVEDDDGWVLKLKHFHPDMALAAFGVAGDDVHHAYESVFKGVARALRIACARDERVTGVPSSKGML